MTNTQPQTIAAATLSPREVARMTGACERTIRRACERGELPAVRIGRRWFISRERFLEKFATASN